MDIQEIDGRNNVNILISRIEVDTLFNAVLVALNLDQDDEFFVNKKYLEEELDLLRVKFRESFSLFPNRMDDRGLAVEGVDEDPEISIWLSELDIKILTDCLGIADEHTDWKYGGIGAERELGRELHHQFKQLIAKWQQDDK